MKMKTKLVVLLILTATAEGCGGAKSRDIGSIGASAAPATTSAATPAPTSTPVATPSPGPLPQEVNIKNQAKGSSREKHIAAGNFLVLGSFRESDVPAAWARAADGTPIGVLKSVRQIVTEYQNAFMNDSPRPILREEWVNTEVTVVVVRDPRDPSFVSLGIQGDEENSKLLFDDTAVKNIYIGGYPLCVSVNVRGMPGYLDQVATCDINLTCSLTPSGFSYGLKQSVPLAQIPNQASNCTYYPVFRRTIPAANTRHSFWAYVQVNKDQPTFGGRTLIFNMYE